MYLIGNVPAQYSITCHASLYRCQLCKTDVLFSFLAVGCHMRDRHPSISFLQYKLTHFHDPKAATAATAASKPATAATATGSKPAAARLYRCRLCPLAVTEAQIKSHLVRAHHAALLRQQEALHDDNDDDDDEIQVLEVIPKPGSGQPVVATTKNPLRRPHDDSQMKRGGTNGDVSPPAQRQRGEEEVSGNSNGEDSGGDSNEEEEEVPRSKRHRPARMFYHEPYNFFRDETGDDPDYVSVPKVGWQGKLR
jgi:hypothetical protein